MSASGILLAVEESELSAAYRVLQELILADHPVVRRHILAALHDLTLRDLQRFVDHASGALIAATVSPEEVETPTLRGAMDALDVAMQAADRRERETR